MKTFLHMKGLNSLSKGEGCALRRAVEGMKKSGVASTMFRLCFDNVSTMPLLRLYYGSTTARKSLFSSAALRVAAMICFLVTIGVGNVWGTDATPYSVTASSGSLSGWSGTVGSAYNDGSVKFGTQGNNLSKTDIWSGDVSTYMTAISVTINYKINGTGSSSNVFTVAAVNSSGTVKASATFAPTSTSYTNATVSLTIPASSAVTGLKITYTTKSSGNVGLKSLSATASYTVSSSCSNPASALAVSASPTTIYTSGASTLSVGETGNGSTVTYSVTSANSAYASIVGTTFSATRPGTYTVQASQDEDDGVCGGTSTVDITVRYQVKWSVNNDDTYNTGSPTAYIEEHDTKVTTLPTAPGSGLCDGSKVFVGWTTSSYSHATNAPGTLFTTASGAPTVTDNVTYYAVFAQLSTVKTATIKATSGNNGDFTGSGTSWSYTDSPATISFSFSGNYYTNGTPNTFTIGKNSSQGTVSITGGVLTQIVDSLSGSDYNIHSVSSGASVTSISNYKQTITFTNGYGTSVTMTGGSGNNNADQIRIIQMIISYKTLSAYATSCCNQLAAPANPGETPNASGAVLTWDAVTGATGYEVKIDDGSWTSTGNGTTTGYTITGKECGGTTVSWQVRATGDGTTNCAAGAATSARNFNTASCACLAYSFHYYHNSAWNAENICFSAVTGATNNYLTDELSLPYAENYKVAWQGTDQFYTSSTGFNGNMPFFHKRDKKFGANPQSGNIGGGKGKFHVYHDSGSTNKYISFIPTGYTLNFGTGDTWVNDATLVFSGATSNWDETVWYTPMTTLTNEQIGKKIFVGLKTSTGYVWCDPYSQKDNLSGLRTKTGSDSWLDGGLTTAYPNKTGKFRIYADSGDKNWYVTFVPHFQLTYNANGGTGSMSPLPATPVSCEETAANRTVTVGANTFTAPSHKTFSKWHTAADGTSGSDVATGSRELTGDLTLYAIWESLPQYTVTLNAGANGSLSVDKASLYSDELGTVTITITPSSGYQLASISAVDGSSNAVALSGTGNTRTFTMPASNVTVTATFTVRTDYVLVESALDDYTGEYLIAYHGSTSLRVLSGRNGNKDATTYATYTDVMDIGGNNYYDSEAKTIQSNATTDAMKMVVEPSSTTGRYTIYFANDATYLGCNTGAGTGATLKFITSANLGSNEHEWRFVWNSTDNVSEVSIYNNANSDPAWRWLLYNTGSPRFALYTSGADIELYKKSETCSRLDAPTGLSESSVTQTTCTLSWNSVTNASGYEVSLDNGSSWTSTSTNTSYNVLVGAGWTQGTSHTWKVRATGDGATYCDKGNVASHTVTMKKAVKVTYNSNGSTGGQLPVAGGIVNLTEGDSHTVLGNTGSGGSPTPLTKSGYTWAGWHSSSTYSATPAYIVGGSITVTENVTLYANWQPKRDTYIDGVQGASTQYGEGAGYSVPSCSDQSEATSGTCEQTHYKFIGWAVSGADLTNPANIFSGGTKTATGATYYAVWGEEL